VAKYDALARSNLDQGESNKGGTLTMLDHNEYSIDGDGYQGNGNGYDGLNGDWALFYKVARGFIRRVKPEDRQDFLHDLLLTMHKVKVKYQAIGKELTEGGLIRIACYDVADYWRKWYKRVNGIDCGSCSRQQREKCKDWYLYPDCPKAVKQERLDKLIEDGNGDSTPLYEMIADDHAVDVAARLEARLILQSYPHRFVLIAYKKYAGYKLTESERQYYWRESKKAQKRLV
jgi:hypothetical protein